MQVLRCKKSVMLDGARPLFNVDTYDFFRIKYYITCQQKMLTLHRVTLCLGERSASFFESMRAKVIYPISVRPGTP
jgi:hypothetical protein